MLLARLTSGVYRLRRHVTPQRKKAGTVDDAANYRRSMPAWRKMVGVAEPGGACRQGNREKESDCVTSSNRAHALHRLSASNTPAYKSLCFEDQRPASIRHGKNVLLRSYGSPIIVALLHRGAS